MSHLLPLAVRPRRRSDTYRYSYTYTYTNTHYTDIFWESKAFENKDK